MRMPGKREMKLYVINGRKPFQMVLARIVQNMRLHKAMVKHVVEPPANLAKS